MFGQSEATSQKGVSAGAGHGGGGLDSKQAAHEGSSSTASPAATASNEHSQSPESRASSMSIGELKRFVAGSFLKAEGEMALERKEL